MNVIKEINTFKSEVEHLNINHLKAKNLRCKDLRFKDLRFKGLKFKGLTKATGGAVANTIAQTMFSAYKNMHALVYAIVSIMFAIVMLFSLSACTPQTNTAHMPVVQFKTIAGKTFDSASLKGQVTLVNFWATSCTTCVKEMPLLVDTYTKYSAKGYRTIAVAMDYDNPAFVAQFSETRKLPFDVMHDADGNIAKAFDGTKLTPTSYLIDKQGRIAKRYVGEPRHDEFKTAIETLLAS